MASVGDEEDLAGGNLSGSVVRVGDTVRRPTGPWTPAVHALLSHLEGYEGAPRLLGIDEQGREVLEFIDGEMAWGEAHRRLFGTVAALRRAGRLLRDFHDAVAGFVPSPDAVWRFPEMAADAAAWAAGSDAIVCHNDVAGWNLVLGPKRWAYIDWDAAGPRPAIWDVAYAAAGLIPIGPDASALGWPQPPPVPARLAALMDGYDLAGPDRGRLPEVIVARIRSSYEHMRRRAEAGIAPWDRLWAGGHGAAWRDKLRYAEEHAGEWLLER